MIQRLHNFSVFCAIVLGVLCIGSLVWSAIDSRSHTIPTLKVLFRELPFLGYSVVLTLFVLPPDKMNSNRAAGLVGILIALFGMAFVFRFFRYSVKHEARQRIEMLTVHQEISQTITKAMDDIQLQAMNKAETESFLKATKPKRASRYERPPVI